MTKTKKRSLQKVLETSRSRELRKMYRGWECTQTFVTYELGNTIILFDINVVLMMLEDGDIDVVKMRT